MEPEDFAAWYDDWAADERHGGLGRSAREDLQEAFEAGYWLASGRLDGSGVP